MEIKLTYEEVEYLLEMFIHEHAPDSFIKGYAGNYINNNFEKIKNACNPEDDKPILVGHTNRKIGLNGFKTCEIGTEVYEYKNIYFIEHIPLKGDIIYRQTYYKESFKQNVVFIDNM